VTDTHFTRSGSSPPRFRQITLTLPEVGEVPPRIGVRSIRISSELKLETRVKRIFQFNFQSVPNSDCVCVPAVWRICKTANPAQPSGDAGSEE
jgi:hypothetical protein